jgi:glutathione S-transferase
MTSGLDLSDASSDGMRIPDQGAVSYLVMLIRRGQSRPPPHLGRSRSSLSSKTSLPLLRPMRRTKNQLDVVDRSLADNECVASKDYTVADMAVLPGYCTAGERMAGRRGALRIVRRSPRRRLDRGSGHHQCC